MATVKKTAQSKMAVDIRNFEESEFFDNSTNTKKTQKRQRNTKAKVEDFSNLIGMYEENGYSKKMKANSNGSDSKEPRLKLLNVMEQQLEARKQEHGKVLKSLLDITSQLEADRAVLKDNEQKLERFAEIIIKCVQQTNAAHSQQLKALKDVITAFKKECEEMDKTHRAETMQLAEELEEDMTNLQKKLVAETKRKQIENLQKKIMQIENEF